MPRAARSASPGTRAARGLSSTYNALQSPGEDTREGAAQQSAARAVFGKHFPELPGPRAQRGAEWGLCFHPNCVTLWMKGTFRKFVK